MEATKEEFRLVSKSLLQRCHDLMDDYNANLDKQIQRPMCHWCNQTGYDGDGLYHDSNCVIMLLRKELG